MGKSKAPDLDLRDFSACGPLLDRAAADAWARNASVCLRQHKQRGNIVLRFTDQAAEHRWTVGVHKIDKAMRATFADLPDATEHGAYGVALLAAARHLGATFAQRMYKGPGFDFLLYPPGAAGATDPDDIFGGTWALEVSGILQGSTADVDARLRTKRKQVRRARQLQPTYVAIVEFSEPSTLLELQ